MNTIELFSGTKSFSKVMASKGYSTFTVDNNSKLEPDLVYDLSKRKFDSKILLDKMIYADIIWMSPPCTTFSMASGNTHWNKLRQPKTDEAILGKRLLLKCREIADWCDKNNKLYFIENPVGRARWFMPKGTRRTISYCQYGDTRKKPTDIWTNLKGWQGRQCRNESIGCSHIRAPRGSKTGTQGLKNAKDRGVIPEKLFIELLDHIENYKGL